MDFRGLSVLLPSRFKTVSKQLLTLIQQPLFPASPALSLIRAFTGFVFPVKNAYLCAILYKDYISTPK